jgi:multiple sugar transport system ATP-binding protein
MAEINLSDVTKRFGGRAAVKDVTFTIGDGEFFVLVGPSGCGKSTLLNLIVGLEDVTDGDILADGQRMNDVDPRDRNMAMVFQNYAIYPHMTVRENIAFPLRMAGKSAEEIDRRVDRTARVLGLEALCDRKPRTLSGGQRQRVAMGRAIVREPRAFLLDEPLSNLDAKLRLAMRTELCRLQRRLGTTTVYVTHDQTEAMTMGDRVAVMRAGEVLQIGTPRQLYERPQSLFVAAFIGSPPMNFLPARLAGRYLELPVGRIELDQDTLERAEAVGGLLVAGLRPEHLCRTPSAETHGHGLEIEARVEVAEWMGSELFVHFDVSMEGFARTDLPEELSAPGGGRDRQSLVARLDPADEVNEGDRIRLGANPRCLHLFDRTSGTALTPVTA